MKLDTRLYCRTFVAYLLITGFGVPLYFIAFMALGFGSSFQSIAPHVLVVSGIYAVFCFSFIHTPKLELAISAFARTVSFATIALIILCLISFLTKAEGLGLLFVWGLFPSAVLTLVTLLRHWYLKTARNK